MENEDVKINESGSQGQGQRIIINQVAPIQQSKNGIGTAGFTLAIIGFFLGWFPYFGWIVWLLGAIFSFIGLFKKPKGLAIAGFIITWIFLIGLSIVIIVVFGGISAFMGSLPFLSSSENTNKKPVYNEIVKTEKTEITDDKKQTDLDYGYSEFAIVNTNGSFPDNLLRIRSTPNTDSNNSNFVISVPKGETVEILERNVKQDYINGESGYWVKVRYSGKGYDKSAKNYSDGMWEGYAWEFFLLIN